MATDPGGALAGLSADECLQAGRRHDAAGRVSDAVEWYATAVDLATGTGSPRVLAEALRRLGVLHNRRAEVQAARAFCQRSYDTAVGVQVADLAAEALNALASFDFEEGDVGGARERYAAALELAEGNPALVGKIAQNLGVLSTMQGDWAGALELYQRALAGYEAGGDRRGCAYAHHNLGMLHADQKRWALAEGYYRTCQRLADAVDDEHLSGLAALNMAEMYVAQAQFDRARQHAEGALDVFSRLNAQRDRAGAHRLLGVIFRETGRPTLAESQLRSALEMGRAAGCPLVQADALRDLAELHRKYGRKQESADCLGQARSLYGRLEAQPDLEEVHECLRELQTA